MTQMDRRRIDRDELRSILRAHNGVTVEMLCDRLRFQRDGMKAALRDVGAIPIDKHGHPTTRSSKFSRWILPPEIQARSASE